MTVITFIVLYGVAWALFSATATCFNDIWGPNNMGWNTPDDSWTNTGCKGVHTIKKEPYLDDWNMASISTKPLKVTAQTSTKVVTQENRKTLPYRHLTTAQANELRANMKRFREKQLSSVEFNEDDTIVDAIPYGSPRSTNWESAGFAEPKGKAGNR